MKRIAIFISISLVYIVTAKAQNLYDGLLTTRELTSGTARSLSMSNSFGALGGDISVVSTNPAGLAVFRNSVFSFTPGIYYNTSNADFNGSSNDDYDYKLSFDNLSFVWSNMKDNKSGFVGSSFAFGYNKLRDFNQRIYMGPIYANSSLLDMFVDVFNNVYTDLSPDDFYEWVAWDADVILQDTITGIYSNDYLESGSRYGQLLEKTIERRGNLGEYFFSLGLNYSDFLYLGGTVGIKRLYYEERTDHLEEDVNNYTDFLQSFNFRDNMVVDGSGFDLKLGLLIKPIDFLRVGAAIHMPTVMRLDYRVNTSMSSVILYDVNDIGRVTSSSPSGISDFKTVTPLKALFSLGFVIDKYGLLNVDYEFVDYRTMRIRSDDASYSVVNTEIKRIMNTTGNIKVGGEVNLGMLALRAGVAQYGDPFKSTHFNSGQNINTVSGGFGVRNKGYFVDFGVMRYSMDENHNLYTDSFGIDQSSSIQTNFIKILATFGFKF